MRVVYSYLTAVAVAFASVRAQSFAIENDQERQMVPKLNDIGDAHVPVTSDYFAIHERSFKDVKAAVSKPTKRPIAHRPASSKPTRTPSQPKPTRKPTRNPMRTPSSAMTSVPTSSPSKMITQKALESSIQPTDMPTIAQKHWGVSVTLEPSSAYPSIKETQTSKASKEVFSEPTAEPSIKETQASQTSKEVISAPTQEPTQPPILIPKHGGVFHSLFPSVMAPVSSPLSKTEVQSIKLPGPITTHNIATLDRSFKGAEELISRPTRRPTTPRRPTVKPSKRPTQPKPKLQPRSKPTRKPVVSPSRTPASVPVSTPSSTPTLALKRRMTSSPISLEPQDPFTKGFTLQPTDMPSVAQRHGGVFFTLEPSPAPSIKETQTSKTSKNVVAEPTQEPTQPPIEIPKHGGVYRSLPPSFRADLPSLSPSKLESQDALSRNDVTSEPTAAPSTLETQSRHRGGRLTFPPIQF